MNFPEEVIDEEDQAQVCVDDSATPKCNMGLLYTPIAVFIDADIDGVSEACTTRVNPEAV